MVQDSTYIAQRAGLTDFKMPWENQRSVEPSTKQKTNYTEYFQLLTDEQVSKLYDIFRLDFEMFGYSATQYLSSLP